MKILIARNQYFLWTRQKFGVTEQLSLFRARLATTEYANLRKTGGVFSLTVSAKVSCNVSACAPLRFSSFWGLVIAICTHTSVSEIVVTVNFGCEIVGPIVQNIVSLMTSLRRQLVKYMPTTFSNALLVLLENCETNKKYQFNIYVWNFNETLTNVVVNFEQLAPGKWPAPLLVMWREGQHLTPSFPNARGCLSCDCIPPIESDRHFQPDHCSLMKANNSKLVLLWCEQ